MTGWNSSHLKIFCHSLKHLNQKSRMSLVLLNPQLTVRKNKVSKLGDVTMIQIEQ